MESSWPSLSRRSIFSIPEAEEARTVPLGACDGEGDLGEAVIGLAVPGKAVSHHHHPLRLSIPFPGQYGGTTERGTFAGLRQTAWDLESGAARPGGSH